tara:strand:+ start:456 stop:1184 length:729 start_codon:yes stop_codon:yes gene_type:complete
MKLTKSKLKQLIKEEISQLLESDRDSDDAEQYAYEQLDQYAKMSGADFDNLVDQVPQLRDGEIVKHLGGGFSGHAYALKNGNVLKIANDPNKRLLKFFQLALKRLHKGDATKNTPMVYDVISLKTPRGHFIVAEMELLNTDEGSVGDSVHKEAYSIYRDMHSMLKDKGTTHEQARSLMQDLNKKQFHKLAKDISPTISDEVLDVLDAMFDARQSSPASGDFTIRNVGNRNTGGKPVYFDPVN